jgi:hypothetical protein
MRQAPTRCSLKNNGTEQSGIANLVLWCWMPGCLAVLVMTVPDSTKNAALD